MGCKRKFDFGARVFGSALTPGAGLSEYMSVNCNDVAQMPPDVPFTHAAALATAFLVPYKVFVNHQLDKRDTAIIVNADSALGAGAVQIAKSMGAKVSATSMLEASKRPLEKLGARKVKIAPCEHLSCAEHSNVTLSLIGKDDKQVRIIYDASVVFWNSSILDRVPSNLDGIPVASTQQPYWELWYSLLQNWILPPSPATFETMIQLNKLAEELLHNRLEAILPEFGDVTYRFSAKDVEIAGQLLSQGHKGKLVFTL